MGAARTPCEGDPRAMPNLIPEFLPFLRPAGRLIWSSLFLLIGTALIVWQMRKPKSDQPSTWAMAMAGSVYVFGLFLLAYAVVPHEIISFCDGYLKWGKDRFLHLLPLPHSLSRPLSPPALQSTPLVRVCLTVF